MEKQDIYKNCTEEIIFKTEQSWIKPMEKNREQISWDDPYRVKVNCDDPEHPNMWNTKKKFLHLIIMFMMIFVIFSSSTFYVPHVLIKPELHTNLLLLSLMLSGLAFGPLIGAPLSKHYGHKKIFLIFSFIFMVTHLFPVILPNQIPITTVFRFLGGLSGGVIYSSCRLSIFDIFNNAKASFPKIFLQSAVLLGIYTGPVIGLLIEEHKQFSWSFWIVMIFSKASPEVILNKRIERLRWVTSSSRFTASIEDRKPLSYIHPFSLTQVYQLKASEIYILLLSHIIGVFLATICYKFESKINIKRLTHNKIEKKLFISIISYPLYILALFWLALTTKKSFHYLVSILSHIILGFSETLILDSLDQYIEASYSEELHAANINLTFPLLLISGILHGVIKRGAVALLCSYYLNKQYNTKTQTSIESKSKIPIYEPQSIINPSGIYEYCNPEPIHDLLVRKGYISYYDRRMRVPSWVIRQVTPKSLETVHSNRKYSKFKEDMSIPDKFRAKLSDYFGSGYDRGHLTPAADIKFSQIALDETFYLTNIAPQVGEGFNRNYWAYFEAFCRNLVSKYSSVYIITGPLYLPKKDSDGKWRVTYEVIGNPPNVAVPTHFFTVIYAEDESRQDTVAVGSFILPNTQIDDDTELSEFIVPISAIERSSGLDLDNISKKKQVNLCEEVECIVKKFTIKNINPPSPE
ncbi:hypothetical protein PCANB_000552 [Pneumocystis canis]|nr:hypothetical protein PCANB_000552 [Pneumocystis canis]